MGDHYADQREALWDARQAERARVHASTPSQPLGYSPSDDLRVRTGGGWVDVFAGGRKALSLTKGDAIALAHALIRAAT